MANDGIHLRTCSLCEAMCGLEITVEDGRVAGIRPDRDDVWSRGYICPKGAALGDLHHDPDRLRVPLIRDGERWREANWEDAFAEVERRLHPVIHNHGMAAVAAYIGNPTAHNFSLSRYAGAFMPLSGITNLYSAGTVDQWPKNVVGALMYGGMWTIPVPDIDRASHLLILGANPSASQGSLMATPDVLGKLDAIRGRGGKVIVIDPRRTGTAAHADEWIPIRPGTDAALLMAMVNVLVSEDHVDLRHLAALVRGVDEVRDLCAPFTADAVAETCAIPAATIRRLAIELADASPGVVYGRIGTCNQEFGTLASWLVEVLNILTGNLDRPGGSMFATPAIPSLATLRPPEFAAGFSFGRYRSRVRGAPEVLGQFPVSCLAEEIAVPGEGRIRALVTIAGNPVLSAPDAGKLDAALPALECMVSLDNYLNETTRHAHVILPGASVLEQPHCGDMIWGWAVRNGSRYSPAVFPLAADRPAEWEILLTLAAIAGGQKANEIDPEALDDLFFAGLVAALSEMPRTRIHGRDTAEIVTATAGRGPDRMTDFMLRSGPFGDGYGANPQGLTLEKLRVHRHGVDLGALEPRLPGVLATADGLIDLAPPYITADLARLRARLERRDAGLLLVSRRHLRSNNSWMHNVERLVRGRDRCTLLIHPEDAREAGLADGDTASIRSRAGAVEVAVEVSDEMMRGVVSLPHGWGHDRDGIRLAVARRHAGANNNLLAPGELVDVPSGNAVVNGIPVQVSPVRRGE
jgi:anaerobic selenocysteine-containing dehydrogenase